MSLYVCIHSQGKCVIYDPETEETRYIKLPRINRFSFLNLTRAIKKLALQVPPETVDRVVYVHNNYTVSDIILVNDDFKKRGFGNVIMVHEISVRLQSLIKNRAVYFKKDDFVLVSVILKRAEFTLIWQYTEGQFKFISTVSSNTSDVKTFISAIQFWIRENKITRWLNVNCKKVGEIADMNMKRVFMISRFSEFTPQEYVDTALWMQKRMEGRVAGTLVENYHFRGFKLFLDGDKIYDSADSAISLPVKWIVDVTKNADFLKLEWQGLPLRWALPSGSLRNIEVNCDSSGMPALKYGLSVGISFYRNSMYIGTGHSAPDDVREPVVNGPFAVNLKLNTDPITVTTDGSSSRSVVANIFDNLNSRKPPGDGWIRSYDSEHVATYIGSNGMTEAISVTKAIVCLLNFALRHVNVPNAVLRAIVLPNDFDKNDLPAIRTAGEMVSPGVTILDERRAMLLGHAAFHQLSKEQKLMYVHFGLQGLSIMLAEFNERRLTVLGESSDDSISSEVLCKNQQLWFKRKYEVTLADSESAPIVQQEDTTDPLGILRKMILALFIKAKVSPDAVKTVLMMGDCYKVPLLMEMMTWKFSNASIVETNEERYRRLAASGAAFCHQTFTM